jgi:hypothetical protein
MDALATRVPLATQELGDLGFKGRLEEQGDTEPGYLFQI